MVCAAALLPSCACNYPLHSMPVPVECTDLEDQVDKGLASSSFVRGELSGTFWWEDFNDPLLTDLIVQSFEANPDLQILSARLRKAAEEAMLARSVILPHVGVYGDYNRQKVSNLSTLPPLPDPFINEATLLLQANYRLDLWGEKRSLYYADIDRVWASYADRTAGELFLATAVAESYFALKGHLWRLDIAQRRLADLEKKNALLVKKHLNGIQAEILTLENDIDVRNVREWIAELESLVSFDIHALSALLGGVPPGFEEAMRSHWPVATFESAFPLPCTLPLDLISRRPEIVAARWRIEASSFDVSSRQAAFYPNVDLLGYVAFTGIQLTKLFTWQSFAMIGDIAANLPLYDGCERQAKLGIAREDLEIAIDEYNSLILQAVREVSDGVAALTFIDQKRGEVSQGVADACRVRTLVEQKYRQGIASRIALLDAEERLYDQEDLLAEYEVARLRAILGLIAALGGGYHECPE